MNDPILMSAGAGAGIVTYLTGSQRAIDGGYPQSSLATGKRRITWKSTWAAGVATSADIEEAVITNQATLADNTSLAAVVISRAILATVNKGANDTLELTWHHDLLGA
jgi:hypothetical protein